MEIDLAETTNKKGKKIFVMSSITYYGSPRKILEVQLGDIHVESKGYQGTK